MADTVKRQLLRQFETAWKLTSYHLDGLTTAECLWRPAGRGPHVRETAGSGWQADWPDREDYAMGPPSIAWLTWHVRFWWSMALDHSFGAGTLSRERVTWPGNADDACASIRQLQHEWLAALAGVDDDDLDSPRRTRWPFVERPFGDVVAWVNVELTKNAAEIGYARFLFAAAGGARP
jgi:hypothetical protein